MKYTNINDFVKLPHKIVDWFDKNLIYGGGLKSITRPDLERGLLLYYLCAKHKVKKALDIGTASFFSARSMAKSGCEVDTIDIKGEKDPKDGWSNINFYLEDSKILLPKFIEEGKKYDICFIDGDHSYEGVKVDIQNCKKLCKIIVCHDYGNLTDVTKAIDEELRPEEIIIEDRMWKGAPYENGIDKNGQPINYGIVVYFNDLK